MAGFDPLSAIIGGVSGAIGAVVSAIGAAVSQGDYDKARGLREKALAEYGDAIAPKLDKATAQEIGPTAFASIQTDASPRNNQIDAMRKLSELYDKGGMGTADEAALQLANEGAQQQSAGDYQSMAQALAQRGQSNNPALAAAMAAKSSGDVVGATSRNRYQAQADARNRAFQALGQSASLAGNIRNTDYGQKADAASAADRINQFNSTQRTNTDLENARRTQADFNNDMSVRGAKYGADNNMANSYQQSGDRTRQTYAGIGSAISSTGAGVAANLPKSGGNYDNAPGGPGGGAPQWQDPSQDEWQNPYRKGG